MDTILAIVGVVAVAAAIILYTSKWYLRTPKNAKNKGTK